MLTSKITPSKKVLFGLCFLAFVSLAQGQVVSNFNIDNESWTVFDNNAGTSTPATYNSIGGNPSGFDFFTTSSAALNMYWTAPAKFNGNFSFSYNQNLTFDLNVSTVGTDNSIGDVKLDGGLILYYQLPTKPLANQWNSYSVQLNELFWHTGSPTGPIATQSQMKQVLSTLSKFQIRAKYLSGNTGPYTVGIDNVVLNIRPLVAPPIALSFTPKSALPGTTLTITGSNFNTSASQNVVYFNGVKATPSSATATQLVVTIPARAAYGRLVVENLGTHLQGASTQSFSPLFDNNKDFGGRIIPSSMTPGYDVLLQNGETASSSNSFGGIDKGDLDGDGWVDLITTETGTQRIFIYRNKGTGGTASVGSFENAMTLPAVSGIDTMGEMIVTDLDSDGKLDIAVVVSNGLQGRYAIYRNMSTSGTISFAAPVTYFYPYYSGTLTMTSGDLDGDGRVDLMGVTETSPSNIYLCQNVSTPGNIDFAFGTTFSFPGIGSYSDIKVKDLNADGKPEIVAGRGTTVHIYPNASTPGTILMNAPITYSPATGMANVVLEDMDADGLPELMWGAPSGLSVYISKNIFNGTIFDATSFSSQITIAGPSGTLTGLSISDINADGKLDIVAATSSDIEIFENISSPGVLNTNSFLPPIQFQGCQGSPAQLLNLEGPVIADLDGDNKPEVAAVYTRSTLTAPVKGIYIFRNESFSTPAISSVSPTTGVAGTALSISGNFMNTNFDIPKVKFGLTPAIAGTTSNISVSSTIPTGVQSDRVSVTLHGLTAYSAPLAVTFPTSRIIDATSFNTPVEYAMTAATDGLTVADFDNDGKTDIVVEDNLNARIFRNTLISVGSSIGATTLIPLTTTYTQAIHVVASDVDGDGKIDLVANSVLHRNNSGSTADAISFEANVSSIIGGNRIAANHDFNHDGKSDFVMTTNGNTYVVNENASRRGVFTNTGGGIFSTIVNSGIGIAAGGQVIGITAGDFDGDGYSDFAYGANNTSDILAVVRNTGLNRPLAPAQFDAAVTFPALDIPFSIASADFDGDGKLDIVLGNNNAAFISIYRNTSTVGTLSFLAKQDIIALTKAIAIKAVDLDGDGKPEIIVAFQPTATTGSFAIFQNTSSVGTISFSAGINYSLTRAPLALSVADINLDAKPDLIFTTNGTTDALVIFENKILLTTIAISTQPSTATICSGTTTTFTTVATGTTNIIYQWQYSSALVGTYNDIANSGGYSNVATSTLSVNTTGNFGAGFYRCKVSGDLAAIVFSNVAQLTIKTTGCTIPVITAKLLATQIGGIITLNLVPLIKTANNNLDLTSLAVISPPASVGKASINSSGVLTIDYTGLNFSGSENIIIKACDLNNNCVQQNFSIDVSDTQPSNEIIVYNAVSSNGDTLNDYLRLENIQALSPKNQVLIYNRWGDEVFSISDYDNKTRVFAGLTNGGSKLPAGTYFYKIVLPDAGKTLTGFLSLKY